jgi:hypothetical protein
MTYRALSVVDDFLILRMNSLVGRSALFDHLLVYLSDNPPSTAHCGFLGLLVPARGSREYPKDTGASARDDVAFASEIRSVNPLRRGRPAESGGTDGLECFPSDHAVMFSALAVGLCFVSLRLGLFATLYVVCAICFPRAYLGTTIRRICWWAR